MGHILNALLGGKRVLLCFLLLLFCGCEQDMQSLVETRSKNAAEDISLYNEGKGKDLGVLSVDQAVELSLKYNLNLWLSRQEQAIAKELRNSALLRMLPQFNFNIAGTGRDAPNASSSVGLFTGQQAQLTTYSYSSAEQNTAWGFGMLWNVMDFGVSFYRWQQNSNQLAIAGQDLRRARQNVMFDTRMAFWKALALREVVNKAQSIEAEIDNKLQDIEKRISSGNITENQVYDIKYKLLKYKQGMITYQENYKIAQAELTRVMGLPLGAKFTLAGLPDGSAIIRPEVFERSRELEKTALLNRPELFQEDLKEKISHTEARLTLLQMLPTPTMLVRHNDDDNSYLYYNNWTSWAMDVSWNLLAVPSRIMEFRGHKKRAEFVKKRRMAMAVAVLTQLHIALIDYDHTLEKYLLSSKLSTTIDKAVQAHLKNMGKGKEFTESQLLAKKVQDVEEYANCMNLYAQLMAAQARVCNTVGLDTLDGEIYAQAVSSSSEEITQNTQALEDSLARSGDYPSTQVVSYASIAEPATAAEETDNLADIPEWKDEKTLTYKEAVELDLHNQFNNQKISSKNTEGADASAEKTPR